MLGGVCGGIAEIYDLNPSLVRIVTLLVILSSGAPIILYLAAWLIIPSKSEVEQDVENQRYNSEEQKKEENSKQESEKEESSEEE